MQIKTLMDVNDVTGFTWDVVFVFDGAQPEWAEKLVDRGFWVPLSWGGFHNAIGFSRHNVESA